MHDNREFSVLLNKFHEISSSPSTDWANLVRIKSTLIYLDKDIIFWISKNKLLHVNSTKILDSLRSSNGMIFSNVLFIVYGISCARGRTYNLEVISGVYNHVHISRVITQPG